jgi:Ca-activated chloride channel family protein
MTLLRPEILLLLLLWWPFCFWLSKQQNNSSHWSQVIEPELLKVLGKPSTRSRQTKSLSLLLLGTLFIVALSGPALKNGNIETGSQGNLYVVLDNSLSMAATDINPSRYSRAKWMIEDWAKSGLFFQTSVTVYAASAHLLTPLTQDTETLKTQLSPLTPYLMPKQGSNPARAFELVAQQIAQQPGQAAHILWLTDEIKPTQVHQLKTIIPEAVTKTVVAVGGSEPTPIPLENAQGYATYNGEMIMVSTQTTEIQRIANELGFNIQALGSQPNANLLNKLSKQRNSLSMDKDIGYWLLIPALLLFLIQLRKNPALLQLSILFISMSLFTPGSANAASLFKNKDQQAYEALQNNDPDTALSLAKDAQLQAQALFDSGQYEQAAELFSSLDTGDNQFNAGNAYAHAGLFEQAIAAYDKALSFGENNAAEKNKKLIEDLLNSQQNNEQQQDSENNDQNANQDQQQSEQGDNQEQQQSEQSNSQKQQQQSDQGDSQEQQQQKADESDDESENDGQQESNSQKDSNDEPKDEDAETMQSLSEPLSPEEIKNKQEVEAILNNLPTEQDSLLRYKFQYQYQQNPSEAESTPW